jgi:FMN reductase
MALKIIGLSGSVTRPSRTTALVRHILNAVERDIGEPARLIELVDEAPHIFTALTRGQLAGRAAQIIRAVEDADILIVGTPVYRASYTGALKHLFDLVHHQAFSGKPVLLAATGGTPLHGLVTEHQLRPLFGFLNTLTLPTAVYAIESDFADYEIVNPKLIERIERAAAEAVAQLRFRSVVSVKLSEPALAQAG